MWASSSTLQAGADIFDIYFLLISQHQPCISHLSSSSLHKKNRDSLFNTSPDQKKTQEVTADSSASTQLWLATNTQHSKGIHNSAVYLRCPSNSHANYHVALLLFQKDQQLDFLFCTFSPIYWQGNWGQQLSLRVDINHLWRICPTALKPRRILTLHTSAFN